jgi:hypothetical protein
MPTFIFEENIAHFKKLLEAETDPMKLERLRNLLREEEAKLEEYKARHPEEPD